MYDQTNNTDKGTNKAQASVTLSELDENIIATEALLFPKEKFRRYYRAR